MSSEQHRQMRYPYPYVEGPRGNEHDHEAISVGGARVRGPRGNQRGRSQVSSVRGPRVLLPRWFLSRLVEQTRTSVGGGIQRGRTTWEVVSSVGGGIQRGRTTINPAWRIKNHEENHRP